MYQVQEVEYMEASLERQLRSGGTSKYVGNFESLAGFPSLHIVYSTSSSQPTSYLAHSTHSLTHSTIHFAFSQGSRRSSEAVFLFSGSHCSIDLINSRNKRFLSPSKAVVMELSRESEGMATPPAFFH